MKRAETCSCSLCNKLYTYLYHHIVVLDKYIHSNLVYYNKHNEDDEPYDSDMEFSEKPSIGSRVVPCGRTGGQGDVTRLIVAFRNFANAPNKNEHYMTGRDDTAICAFIISNLTISNFYVLCR